MRRCEAPAAPGPDTKARPRKQFSPTRRCQAAAEPAPAAQARSPQAVLPPLPLPGEGGRGGEGAAVAHHRRRPPRSPPWHPGEPQRQSGTLRPAASHAAAGPLPPPSPAAREREPFPRRRRRSRVARIRASPCAETAMRAADSECADQPEGLPMLLAGVFTYPRRGHAQRTIDRSRRSRRSMIPIRPFVDPPIRVPPSCQTAKPSRMPERASLDRSPAICRRLSPVPCPLPFPQLADA